ncbi:hypothetical protein DPMN_191012 [Dreissena polymorpha]|uniref:Uncharacterized protein n=1 Tax=Dreissena polymorpha TaxID=45954 RepID=A0A9D4BE27_DREPO|nr:hypothetical protein DPMN_191012 [Dreissena polymorpha]
MANERFKTKYLFEIIMLVVLASYFWLDQLICIALFVRNNDVGGETVRVFQNHKVNSKSLTDRLRGIRNRPWKATRTLYQRTIHTVCESLGVIRVRSDTIHNARRNWQSQGFTLELARQTVRDSFRVATLRLVTS